MIRLAIFASGAGTNANRVIEYFKEHQDIKVALVVSNKEQAGVMAVAMNNQVPALLIEKERFFRGDGFVEELKKNDIHFIVLAGFLWKIPPALIEAYRNRIINIHPALLPSYGGKGMYGMHVHEAVLAAKEKESGISIHYVDEHYDNGDLIFQAKVPVLEDDTPESLAQRIHEIEYKYYPEVIERVVTDESTRIQITKNK